MLFLTFTAGAARGADAAAGGLAAGVAGAEDFGTVAGAALGAALAAAFGAGGGGVLAAGLDTGFGATFAAALGAGLGAAFAPALAAGLGVAFAAAALGAGLGAGLPDAFAGGLAVGFTGAFAVATGFLAAGLLALGAGARAALLADAAEIFLVGFFTGKSLFVPCVPRWVLCWARPASGPVSEKAGSLTNAASLGKACRLQKPRNPCLIPFDGHGLAVGGRLPRMAR